MRDLNDSIFLNNLNLVCRLFFLLYYSPPGCNLIDCLGSGLGYFLFYFIILLALEDISIDIRFICDADFMEKLAVRHELFVIHQFFFSASKLLEIS